MLNCRTVLRRQAILLALLTVSMAGIRRLPWNSSKKTTDFRCRGAVDEQTLSLLGGVETGEAKKENKKEIKEGTKE